MVGDLDEGRGAEMTTQIELAIEPDVAEKQQVMTADADRDGQAPLVAPFDPIVCRMKADEL